MGLYSYIAANTSDAAMKINAQSEVVKCRILAGDEPAIDAAIEKFKSDYSNHQMRSERLNNIANALKRVGRYDKASDLFMYISQNSTDSMVAQKTGVRAIISRIQSKDYEGAEEMFDQFWNKYRSAEGFVDRVVAICNIFERHNDPAMALPYITRALEVVTDLKQAIRLLRLKAECYIEMGAEEQAQAVQDEIAMYAEQEYYPGVQLAIADKYLAQFEYEKAIEVYEKVLNVEADHYKQLHAYKGIGKSYVRLGSDPNVLELLDIISDVYSNHKRLAYTIYVIGEEYYIIGEKLRDEKKHTQAIPYYQKAIDIWKQRILDSMQGCSHEAEAYLFSGICHMRLKQYSEASECMKKVIQDWPKYRYVAAAFSWYQVCLKVMPEKGLITKQEAARQAEEVFIGFVEKNPNHVYASLSLRMLGDFYFGQSRNDDAILCYEKLIESDFQQLKYVHNKYCKALEAVGREDTAQEVRRVLAEIQ